MNRKLSHNEALHFIKDYFMGGSSGNIKCEKDSKGECSINGSGLHPEWCEMTSDKKCIYNNPNLGDISLKEISIRLSYKSQKMPELKKILNKISKKDLKNLAEILEIKKSGNRKKLIDKIIKHRILSIINGEPVWSFY